MLCISDVFVWYDVKAQHEVGSKGSYRYVNSVSLIILRGTPSSTGSKPATVAPIFFPIPVHCSTPDSPHEVVGVLYARDTPIG